MKNRQATQLLFELSRPGRRAHVLPPPPDSGRDVNALLPEQQLADTPPPLPELAEGDVVRHFVNLSTQNMSVDTHFYPLGSCTMKYNPKRNERLASLPGLVDVHPMQDGESIQGLLEMMFELQGMLGEISGLPGVSLQPAAGAHGELTALFVAAAYFEDLQQQRTVVLTADSAHGTNPASAQMAGFSTRTVKSNADGLVDMDDLRSKLGDDVAVFMLTNPNTLGLFDSQIAEITELVHSHGALIYLDGANMNAILGITRPGDFGADLMHFNPHKTFSGPHGGGGPGAGPICVGANLAKYLPGPIVVQDEDRFRLVNPDRSIGRVRSFFGNVGVLVRAYAYIRTYGPDGLRRVSEDALLGANYLLSKVKHLLEVPHGDRLHARVCRVCHETEKGTALVRDGSGETDFGLRFPRSHGLLSLVVDEAVMVEPTETESKETLDAFADAIAKVIEESGDTIHEAPHSTDISRPDDVTAARKPGLAVDGRNGVSAIGLTRATMDGHLFPMASLTPPMNMALDQAILDQVSTTGVPTLRFYGWDRPTLSLGYFQSHTAVPTSLADVDAVRRSTGGGAILHHHELTYSIAMPIQSSAGGARAEFYRAMHRHISDELADVGIKARPYRLDPRLAGDENAFLCFQRRTDEDLIVSGLQGAGQRAATNQDGGAAAW